MRRLLSIFTCLLLLTAVQVHAQAVTPTPPPVYAVLSLVGDQLTIVATQPRSDTNLSPYKREALPVEEAVFDNFAIGAAGDAIRKAIPLAELSALQTRSAVLFDRQRVLFEEKGAVISVPEAIRAELQRQKATFLVLVTKHRDNVSLQFDTHGDAGGKLEGLGFFVDDTIYAAGSASAEGGRGFIAPYAYVRIALIDTKTWRVIAKQTITASTMITSSSAPDAASQWGAMTAAEKMRSMDRLLRREFGKAIPLLLKAG